MTKWEYCYLLSDRTPMAGGYYLMKAGGAKRKISDVRNDLFRQEAMELLAWLGEQGWEAVNYTLEGLGWQVLLKRPIEST